ncbi:hypothetical protein RND81_07G155400 [Saponaria officinalis]|uniref:Protein FAR1-RELATED SEQUENCE n=1 Tax=Saponaria officinalis TaxID=3572 RepID=A0AAW1JNR0_SAPOF
MSSDLELEHSEDGDSQTQQIFTFDHTLDQNDEVLFYGLTHMLARSDFKSLLPNTEILMYVIECWSIVLNESCFREHAPVITSRCFPGLSHSQALLKMVTSKAKIDIEEAQKEVIGAFEIWLTTYRSKFNLDSNLVFIPLLSDDRDHYSCVCVNFSTSQLEYLDSRSYEDDLKKTIYGKTAIMALTIGATKTYKMCKERVNGFANIGSSLNDFKNFHRDVKCYINERDGQLFIDCFKNLADTREDFYFDYEVDVDNSLTRAVWADGTARRNYAGERGFFHVVVQAFLGGHGG